ncbi:MAG: hypothetical protein M1833_004425 [Piccolia ochrophora]|nr:MAG: hypothetical protein M1833_004425 [Piccolia ochrophora]
MKKTCTRFENQSSTSGFLLLETKRCAARKGGAASPTFALSLTAKLAETYESDDALDWALQPATIRYRPASPTPPPTIPPLQSTVHFPDNVSTLSSETPRKRSNRRKTRPSQGDAVLISFLEPNRPDIAREAGANPLDLASASEGSDVGSDMDGEDQELPTSCNHSADEALVNTAQNALRAVDTVADHPKAHTDDERSRKKLLTDLPQDVAKAEDGSRNTSHDEDMAMQVDPKSSEAPVKLKERSPQASHAHIGPRSSHTEEVSKGEIGASSMLRGHAISKSECSPQRTLPAMQPLHSPSGTSAVVLAQGEKPNLPSLHSHLNQLAEAASKDVVQGHDGRTNGPKQHQSSFSPVNGGHVQTSPSGGGTFSAQERSRVPIHYITPSPRQHYVSSNSPSGHYPASQSSPASSYSEVSPQDAVLHSLTLPSLSPPVGTTGSNGSVYYRARRTSQLSEQGPPLAEGSRFGSRDYETQSNDGHHGAESPSPGVGGARTGPQGELDDVGTTDASVPHQKQRLTNNGFRCSHPGCSALPFQTQYLLNSHANVHSQIRPHYCPVPGCTAWSTNHLDTFVPSVPIGNTDIHVRTIFRDTSVSIMAIKAEKTRL